MLCTSASKGSHRYLTCITVLLVSISQLFYQISIEGGKLYPFEQYFCVHFVQLIPRVKDLGNTQAFYHVEKLKCPLFLE